MITIESWLKEATVRLRENGVDSPLLEAQILLGNAMGRDRTWLITHSKDILSNSSEYHAAERDLTKRLNHVPLAYITGVREFFGRVFQVSEATLIPRADTEILVEAAIEVLPQGAKILDLGTGTGCIGITLKLERPDLQVTVSDISPEALSIAKKNVEALGARLEFVLSDCFESLGSYRFNHLVSNPPYVETSAELTPEVRFHEPSQALFAGEDGLDFYRRLAKEVDGRLTSGSWILLELGHSQADAVRDLFPSYGAREWKDLAGIRRVIGLQRRD